MENEFKAIVMHGFTQEQAVTIMRAIKSLGFGGKTTAFATTTPSNLEWKLSDLIGHLKEENESVMKKIGKA